MEAPARHVSPAGEAGMAMADAAAGDGLRRDKGPSWVWREFFDTGMYALAGELCGLRTPGAWRGNAWQRVGHRIHTMAAACICGMCGVCAPVQSMLQKREMCPRSAFSVMARSRSVARMLCTVGGVLGRQGGGFGSGCGRNGCDLHIGCAPPWLGVMACKSMLYRTCRPVLAPVSLAAPSAQCTVQLQSPSVSSECILVVNSNFP